MLGEPSPGVFAPSSSPLFSSSGDFKLFFFEVMVKVTGELSQGVLQESGVRLLGALWLLCSDLGHLL